MESNKKLKQPIVSNSPIKKSNGTWARTNSDKSTVFAEYLAEVYSPNQQGNSDSEIKDFLNAPNQSSLPIKSFTPKEVFSEIKLLNPCKAPEHDLIVGDVLKNLPRKAIVLLTTILNRILEIGYYPMQWKLAQVIMVLKPGKPPTNCESYSPINLLPIMSKLFEKLLLKRLEETTPLKEHVPDHQFGFRNNHSTIQQCHRIVNKIKTCLETGEYCTSVFLDVKQAFDRVWHEGLLYKLKKILPGRFYKILKSYLNDRYLQVKTEDSLSDYKTIRSGVPQGSILGPILYLIYTSDIPQTDESTIATFADDTAIITSDADPLLSSQKLQNHLDAL